MRLAHNQLSESQGGMMAAMTGYAQPLRAIGQALEILKVQGFEMEQVGEDFVVGAHKEATVNAFCIERSRWTNTREGKSTGGRFEVLSELATHAVRVAGQYEKDQSKVWGKVAEANAQHANVALALQTFADTGDNFRACAAG